MSLIQSIQTFFRKNSEKALFSMPDLDQIHTSVFSDGRAYLSHPRGFTDQHHFFRLKKEQDSGTYALEHTLQGAWKNHTILTGLSAIDALKALYLREMLHQNKCHHVTDASPLQTMPAIDAQGEKSHQPSYLLNFLRANPDLHPLLPTAQETAAFVETQKTLLTTPLTPERVKLGQALTA